MRININNANGTAERDRYSSRRVHFFRKREEDNEKQQAYYYTYRQPWSKDYLHMQNPIHTTASYIHIYPLLFLLTHLTLRATPMIPDQGTFNKFVKDEYRIIPVQIHTTTCIGELRATFTVPLSCRWKKVKRVNIYPDPCRLLSTLHVFRCRIVRNRQYSPLLVIYLPPPTGIYLYRHKTTYNQIS